MDKEILYRFFEGSTIFEEEVKIKEWINLSDDNRKQFFRERKIFDAIQLSDEKTINTLKNNQQSGIQRKTLYKIIQYAAIIIMSFGLTWYYNYWQNSNRIQTIEVPLGHRTNILLPDGSNVWLNSGTKLSYNLSFNTFNREVELDGEAYFDVTTNHNNPFIVKSSKGVIEVLGTRFNVTDYSRYNEYETALIEGSVKIYANINHNHVIVLPPGKMTHLETGKLTDPYSIDDYGQFRWREGLICFKNASFTTIMNEFQKYYGLKIQVENTKYKDLYYTGKFRQEDGIDYALRVLQKDIGFDYLRDDDNKLITIK